MILYRRFLRGFAGAIQELQDSKSSQQYMLRAPFSLEKMRYDERTRPRILTTQNTHLHAPSNLK